MDKHEIKTLKSELSQSNTENGKLQSEIDRLNYEYNVSGVEEVLRKEARKLAYKDIEYTIALGRISKWKKKSESLQKDVERLIHELNVKN